MGYSCREEPRLMSSNEMKLLTFISAVDAFSAKPSVLWGNSSDFVGVLLYGTSPGRWAWSSYSSSSHYPASIGSVGNPFSKSSSSSLCSVQDWSRRAPVEPLPMFYMLIVFWPLYNV